jgi:hypothetical protein
MTTSLHSLTFSSLLRQRAIKFFYLFRGSRHYASQPLRLIAFRGEANPGNINRLFRTELGAHDVSNHKFDIAQQDRSLYDI